MSAIKKYLRPPFWLVCLSALSFPALIWIFANQLESRWFAYPVYLVSAYALAVVCIRLVPLALRWCRGRKQSRQAEEALTPEQRLQGLGKDLLQDIAVNLAFGLFYLFSGCRQGSPWLIANGLYNLAQTLIYAIPAYYQRKLSRHYDLCTAWKGYTVMGWWLTVLNLTMTGCVFLVIWRGERESYPGILVFAMAALTFYKLGMSILDLVRYRHNNSPILGAACNAGHTEAIMSVFMLQTALFSAFGQDYPHQKLMNTLTGSAVCLMTVLGAVGMVLHGRKRIKEGKETLHG